MLLIAEAANPEWVSVPLLGWAHSRALAKVADVHVVTQIRNRDAFLRAGLTEGKDFTAIDSEAVAAPLHRAAEALRGGLNKGWTTVSAASALAYYYFERQLWRRFGSDIKAGKFDVVHRLKPQSPTVQSPIARRLGRAGVPFVIGPLNGGLPWPPQFRSAQHAEREWLAYVRGAYRLLPYYEATRRAASALIVGSEATLEQLPAQYHSKAVYIPENAVDPERFPARNNWQFTTPLHLIFVGRLVPYKGADILVEAAVPLLKEGLAQITIVGDGPERPALAALAERLQVTDKVHLLGNVPHQTVQEHLRQADLLVFPSIREFGGAVILEAMAVGVVPMVVAYGGPAEYVTQGNGYPIPLGTKAELIARFRRELYAVARSPQQLERRAALGQQYVRDAFTWETKAQQTLKVYEFAMGRGPRPDFGRPLRAPTPTQEGV